MTDFLFDAFSFDWRQTLIDLVRVAIAFARAVPIGWERHRSERNLGLRTFPIESACLYLTRLSVDTDSSLFRLA